MTYSKCLSCKIVLGPRHYDFSRWCSFCSPLRTSIILSPPWFECLSHVTIARSNRLPVLKARAIFCSKDRVVPRDTSDSCRTRNATWLQWLQWSVSTVGDNWTSHIVSLYESRLELSFISRFYSATLSIWKDNTLGTEFVASMTMYIYIYNGKQRDHTRRSLHST